jgi:hypothetical protein
MVQSNPRSLAIVWQESAARAYRFVQRFLGEQNLEMAVMWQGMAKSRAAIAAEYLEQCIAIQPKESSE